MIENNISYHLGTPHARHLNESRDISLFLLFIADHYFLRQRHLRILLRIVMICALHTSLARSHDRTYLVGANNAAAHCYTMYS